MTRIRTIAALAVVAALALTGIAAGAVKIKGGTTQIKLSPAPTSALTANHLTVTPLSPATASGSTFTFPIGHGRLKRGSLRGFVRHSGGFTISNGTRTVTIRHLTLVSTRRGVSLFARVRAPRMHRHGKGASAHGAIVVVRRIARVTDVQIKNRTATGTLRLSAFSAKGINALAGKTIARAGTAVGSITVAPAFR